MRHLQEHQLLLSQSVAGEASLTQLLQCSELSTVNPKNIQCSLHMSGRFFSPLFTVIDGPRYAQYNPSNFWLYYSELIDTSARCNHLHWHKKIQYCYKTKNIQYCLLPKQYWLSELIASDIQEAKLRLFDKGSLVAFLQSEYQESQWQLAIIDKTMLDKQHHSAQTLAIEQGRLFIIRRLARLTR